jgi:hypothetical protein
MKIKIARPSPAMVLAMIALFASLGGSALAVSGVMRRPPAQPSAANSRFASASSSTGTPRHSTATSSSQSATRSAKKESE